MRTTARAPLRRRARMRAAGDCGAERSPRGAIFPLRTGPQGPAHEFDETHGAPGTRPSRPILANAQVSSRTRGWEVRARLETYALAKEQRDGGQPTAPGHPRDAWFPPVSRDFSAGLGESMGA